MSIADKDKTPLERMADKLVRGEYSVIVPAVRFSQLNPEQQLAHVLEQLVEHQKGHLALLNTLLPLSAACVEWRKTTEGQAWVAKKAKERAEQEERKLVVQQIDARLLAALKKAHGLLDTYSQGDHTGRPWLREIEEAIAQAEKSKS